MTKFFSAAVLAVTSTGAMAGSYSPDVLTAMEVARAQNVCAGRGTLTDAVFTENGQVRATCSGAVAGAGGVGGLSPLAAGGIVAGALGAGLLLASGDDDDDDDDDGDATDGTNGTNGTNGTSGTN